MIFKRHFLNIRRSVLSLAFICGLLIPCCPVSAVTQSEIDALELQREEIREHQSNLREQLESLKTDRDSIFEHKAALDAQVELLRQDVVILNEEIEIYNDIVAEKQALTEQAKQEEAAQYQRYTQRIRAIEENGNWSYLSFVFKATSFSDLLSRIDDVTDIISRDQKIGAEYSAARELAESTQAEYEGIQREQMAKRQELTQKEEQLETEIENAGLLIADLEEDIDAYTAVYEQVEAEKVEIQTRIDEMVAALQRQQEEEAATKAVIPVATSSNSLEGNTGQFESSYMTSIAANPEDETNADETNPETIYQWPSYCTVLSYAFGYRLHPIFHTTKYHGGVDIVASHSTEITAAAAGTVILAENSSGYGNYVAIYHDNGITTLYAHMSSMTVVSGQTVSAGEVIGYVGSTGACTTPHLHFELRESGTCVDPLPYFNVSVTYEQVASST